METHRVKILWRVKSQWEALPPSDRNWGQLCILEIRGKQYEGTAKMIVQALSMTETTFEFDYKYDQKVKQETRKGKRSVPASESEVEELAGEYQHVEVPEVRSDSGGQPPPLPGQVGSIAGHGRVLDSALPEVP